MSEHPPSFWEKDSTIRAIKGALYVGCFVSLVGAGAAWLGAIGDPHPHFHWAEAGGFEINEFTPGFFAAFGFFAYMGIVNTAKLLRTVVMRGEDYYGE